MKIFINFYIPHNFNMCDNCNASSVPLLACGRCMTVKYCSRNCQKQHWAGHREVCAPPKPVSETVECDGEQCPICMSRIDDSAVKLQCEHLFHAHCVKDMRSHGVSPCPLCAMDGPQAVHDECYRAYVKKDINEKMIERWTMAAEQGHEPSQFMLGVLYYEGKVVVKNDAVAESWFRKASTVPNAWTNLGIIFLKRGELALAKEVLDKAICFDYKNATAFFHLACCKLQMNDEKVAMACFRRVVELDPSHVEAIYNIGLLLAKNKATRVGAIAYFKRVLELNRDHDAAKNLSELT